MRVILDTCVLFSTLRSSQGASYKLITSLSWQKFKPVVSTPLFFEYEEVLLRPKQFPHLTIPEINDFLDYIAASSEHCRISFLWRPFLPDPGDDLVLEAAFSAEVDAIVTYNIRDFAGSEKLGIHVISPSAFVDILKL
jgi:putative PIN family toxin of toxin-antitoxin system